MTQENTLTEVFRNRVAKFGDKPLLFRKEQDGWKSLSYNDLLSTVQQTSAGLHALGLRKGDRVGLIAENRPEWAISDLSIMCLGAINVPIYVTSTSPQIQYILENSGCSALFVSHHELLAKIRQIRDQLPELATVIIFDPPGELNEGEISLADLQSKAAQASEFDFNEATSSLTANSLASLIYTSGTTGPPKGVMLSHGNFTSNVISAGEVIPIGPEDRHLSFLPLCHAFERTAGWYMMLNKGVEIWYAESIEQVVPSLEEVRPTIFMSVPRLYEKVHNAVLSKMDAASGLKGKMARWALAVAHRHSDRLLADKPVGGWLAFQHKLADKLVLSKVRGRFGGRVKMMCSGGAALSPIVARFFFDVGLLILEGYGLTETSPVACINRPDAFRFGTVGPVIPGVEISIAEDCEILIRGPNIMQGYFKNETATQEVIDEDGWFHSGDVGKIENGFLKITDRKKDLLVTSGGKNVAPQVLENIFKTAPLISEFVVCGDSRNYLTALIVPDFDNLRAWAKQNGITASGRPELLSSDQVTAEYRRCIDEMSKPLARYETIKKFTLLPEEFSLEAGQLTPTMKVKRKAVYTQFDAQIQAMY